MPTYKAQWKECSVNEEFWNEVLIGRTIKSVQYHADGLKSFTLDNGEVVYVYPQLGTLMVKTDDAPLAQLDLPLYDSEGNYHYNPDTDPDPVN